MDDKIEEHDEEARRPPPVDVSWMTTELIRDAPGVGFGLGIFIIGLVLIGVLLFVAMTRP
jgi:hypothetical protein